MARVQNMCLLREADEKKMLGHRVVLWHLLSGGIFPLLPEKEVSPTVSLDIAGKFWRIWRQSEPFVGIEMHFKDAFFCVKLWFPVLEPTAFG